MNIKITPSAREDVDLLAVAAVSYTHLDVYKRQDYNPYTNSIDVNTFENYIFRIAAFCGLSFLLATKITSKLSNFILHHFGGLHKLWDAPTSVCCLHFGQ